MLQPDELKSDRPLLWSTGTGTQVWAMFQAAITGDLPAMQTLVAATPGLVRCHYAYRTPLYFAVRENQLAIVQFLLDRLTDPLALAVNDSLLDIARDRGHTRLLEYLQARLAQTQHASPEAAPVSKAIRDHDLPQLKTLLDQNPALLHTADFTGNQPLHWATMTRWPDMIDELLARGADINARRPDGARPLQLTNGDYHHRGWRDVPKDHPHTPQAILAHLLAKGAYYDICTACQQGDLARVTQLLSQDPSLANKPDPYITYYAGSGTPLTNAAGKGNLPIVRLLLQHGADPNLPEEGIAPQGGALYAAATAGHYDVAKLLLEHGAFPNPPVESSADAISRALHRNDQPMVTLLCSFGGARSLDILTYDGDTRTIAAILHANPALASGPDAPNALSNAAEHGHESLIRLLLKYNPTLASRIGLFAKTRALTQHLFDRGMNPNHREWLLITPLHQFARNNKPYEAAFFLDQGASLDARDEDLSSTPLAWAAKFNRPRMVELLLRRGAKPSLPSDPAWATPLAWATRRGHTQIVDLLTHFENHATLPPRPLSQYDQLAQDLISGYQTGDQSALDRLTSHYQPRHTNSRDNLRAHINNCLDLASDPAAPSLSIDSARHYIARTHGFHDWSDLTQTTTC